MYPLTGPFDLGPKSQTMPSRFIHTVAHIKTLFPLHYWIKLYCKPAVVAQTCNPSTQEAGARQLPSVPDQPGLYNEIQFQKKKNSLPVYTKFCFFSHLPIGIHLGHFHCLAIMCIIVVEIPIQGLVCIPGFHPLGQIPRSGFAGSCGKPVYLWRCCQTVFHKHYTILYFHQQRRRAPGLHFPTQRLDPPRSCL